MENLQKNDELLLELIDIIMGNKPLKELSITELAFENTVCNNIYSGYIYDIEHLLTKLRLINYGDKFSNVYYLWNKYKYNLNHNLVQNEELENELWGVLLNAELVHEEEQLMLKEIEEEIEEIEMEPAEEMEPVEEKEIEQEYEIEERIDEINNNYNWCVII